MPPSLTRITILLMIVSTGIITGIPSVLAFYDAKCLSLQPRPAIVQIIFAVLFAGCTAGCHLQSSEGFKVWG